MQAITYRSFIAGGVTIEDEIGNKRIQVYHLSQDLGTTKKIYEVIIDEKKLILPNGNPLFFSQPLYLKFTLEKNWIKIWEEDANSSSPQFYVDLHSAPTNKTYRTYSYRPQEMSKERAEKVIELTLGAYPSFEVDTAVYNRHGIAAFGWEDQGLVFYWASPQDEILSPIPCSRCERSDVKTLAHSKDGKVIYEDLLVSKKSFLNGEPAKKVELKTSWF